MKSYQVKLGSIIVVIAGLGLLYPVFVGGSGTHIEDDPSEIVYVDIKSGKAFVLPSRASPEENPETGAKTLVPGMYCSACTAWKPVGSLENRQSKRFTRKCPIHKIPLIRDGPLPE